MVKSLPLKPQVRPVLLGVELDMAVQQYVQALRTAGGVVNTTIVIAAAMGIVSARDPTKFTSHGGHINITKTWAVSIRSDGVCKTEVLQCWQSLCHSFEDNSGGILG